MKSSQLIATICLLLASASLFANSVVQLRILETTDIHVYVVDYDYFQDRPAVDVGLARTATLIRDARAEVSHSCL